MMAHHSKSVRHLATSFTTLTRSQERYASTEGRVKSDLADIIRQEAPASCFMQLHDKVPFASKPKPVCPPAPKELAIGLGHLLTTQELADAMVLTDKEAADLNLFTIGQSDSENWFQHRHGRITASNFHRVYTRMNTLKSKPSADPKPLIRTLMGYLPQPVSVAMKHGKAMEPHAKRNYKAVISLRHKGFKVNECGLFISKDYPFLGASPDLLTSCTCCGKGICEIKCPESIKDQIPTFENYKHLVKNNSGSTTLSKPSEYYTQVQGLMGILGVDYCDIFVYTAKGYHIERICFDPTFWESVQSNLIQFWVEYLSVELIYGSLANSEVVDNSLTDHIYNTYEMGPIKQNRTAQLKSKSMAAKGPLSRPKLPCVYLCGKCAEVIVDNPETEQQESIECCQCQLWFHRNCARLTDLSSVSDNKEWLCFNCK